MKEFGVISSNSCSDPLEGLKEFGAVKQRDGMLSQADMLEFSTQKNLKAFGALRKSQPVPKKQSGHPRNRLAKSPFAQEATALNRDEGNVAHDEIQIKGGAAGVPKMEELFDESEDDKSEDDDGALSQEVLLAIALQKSKQKQEQARPNKAPTSHHPPRANSLGSQNNKSSLTEGAASRVSNLLVSPEAVRNKLFGRGTMDSLFSPFSPKRTVNGSSNINNTNNIVLSKSYHSPNEMTPHHHIRTVKTSKNSNNNCDKLGSSSSEHSPLNRQHHFQSEEAKTTQHPSSTSLVERLSGMFLAASPQSVPKPTIGENRGSFLPIASSGATTTAPVADTPGLLPPLSPTKSTLPHRSNNDGHKSDSLRQLLTKKHDSRKYTAISATLTDTTMTDTSSYHSGNIGLNGSMRSLLATSKGAANSARSLLVGTDGDKNCIGSSSYHGRRVMGGPSSSPFLFSYSNHGYRETINLASLHASEQDDSSDEEVQERVRDDYDEMNDEESFSGDVVSSPWTSKKVLPLESASNMFVSTDADGLCNKSMDSLDLSLDSDSDEPKKREQLSHSQSITTNDPSNRNNIINISSKSTSFFLSVLGTLPFGDDDDGKAGGGRGGGGGK